MSSPWVFMREPAATPGTFNVIRENVKNGKKIVLCHAIPEKNVGEVISALSYQTEVSVIEGKYGEEIAAAEAALREAGVDV